jgi:hypothetical protein
MMILVESDGGHPLVLVPARKKYTKVTISNGADCKLYDAVCAGESSGR